MDLSYIPEKYSLDVERASRILNEGLKKWLLTIEEFVSGDVVQDNTAPSDLPGRRSHSSCASVRQMV